MKLGSGSCSQRAGEKNMLVFWQVTLTILQGGSSTKEKNTPSPFDFSALAQNYLLQEHRHLIIALIIPINCWEEKKKKKGMAEVPVL